MISRAPANRVLLVHLGKPFTFGFGDANFGSKLSLGLVITTLSIMNNDNNSHLISQVIVFKKKRSS
jgi:hypothetical protein